MGDWNLSHQNQTSHIFNGSNSANNHTDQDDEILSEIVYYMYGLFLPTISSLGVVGNILSFVVLYQLSKSSSFYLYTACLALSDTAALIIGVIICLLNIGGMYQSSESFADMYCSVPVAISLIFSQLSSWITVAVTVDRYIAVCYPFNVTKYCTRKRALIYIGVVFLVIVAVNLPIICFQWDDEYSSCALPEFTYDYCFQYISYIDMLIYVAIPFCIICTLNTLIIREIYKAARRRRLMRSYNENSVSSTNDVNDPITKTVTMFLTLTSFSVISFLPFIGLSLFGIVFDVSWTVILERFPMFLIIVDICALLNHSVNFILYGLSGQRFRKQFVKVFCCRRF